MSSSIYLFVIFRHDDWGMIMINPRLKKRCKKASKTCSYVTTISTPHYLFLWQGEQAEKVGQIVIMKTFKMLSRRRKKSWRSLGWVPMVRGEQRVDGSLPREFSGRWWVHTSSACWLAAHVRCLKETEMMTEKKYAT